MTGEPSPFSFARPRGKPAWHPARAHTTSRQSSSRASTSPAGLKNRAQAARGLKTSGKNTSIFLMIVIFWKQKTDIIRKTAGGAARQVVRSADMKETKNMPDKVPDKATAMDRLRDGEVQLPPLKFKLVEAPARPRRGTDEFDAILDVSWKGKRYRFAVEYKLRSTPKVFDEALARLGGATLPGRLYPMLIVPYLSPAQLADLEKRKISGVDLCGNGIVIVPAELCVVRSGQRNRYPQSDPIKNIYRGASSIVPRVFLTRPRFGSISDIETEIWARDGRVAISTISKAVATLEQDLIVSKKVSTQEGVQLLQPETLLDQLSRNYRAPRIERQATGQSSVPLPVVARLLAERATDERFRCVTTGVGSIGQYAIMAREPKVQVYCNNLKRAMHTLGERFQETSRFANVELFETRDQFAYFDPRVVDGIPWASPVQVFLELASGDKRDQETADQVRARILREIGS